MSTAAEHPLAHIPIAQREGVRSPRLGKCERALPKPIVVLLSIVTRPWLLTTDWPSIRRHLHENAPRCNDAGLSKDFYGMRGKHGEKRKKEPMARFERLLRYMIVFLHVNPKTSHKTKS